MKLVYVAGPYRAPTQEQIDKNIQNAILRARDVLLAGNLPVTPHLLSIGKTTSLTGSFETTDQVWREGLILLVERCDEVWLFDGWEKSNGTLAEVRKAFEHRIPVILPSGEVLRDLKERDI